MLKIDVAIQHLRWSCYRLLIYLCLSGRFHPALKCRQKIGLFENLIQTPTASNAFSNLGARRSAATSLLLKPDKSTICILFENGAV